MEKIAAILLVVGLVAGVAGGYGGAFVTSISSLQSENSDLNSKLTTSQSELTTSNSELSTSQTELSNTQSQLTKSQSDLTAEQAKTSDLDAKISNANEMIESLKADVAASDAKITATTGQVAVAAVEREGNLLISIFIFATSTEEGGWDGSGYITIEDLTDNKVLLFNFFLIDKLTRSGDTITLTGEVGDTNDRDRYLDSTVVITMTNGGTTNESILIGFPNASPPASPVSLTGLAIFCEPGECEE